MIDITFFNKDRSGSFRIRISNSFNVWLSNQDGEGGEFDSDEIGNIVYEALEKYFKENF